MTYRVENKNGDTLQARPEGYMMVWCAKHRDGWCAINPNRKPAEGINQVKTKCEFFICLPWGIEKREPTCADCRARRMT